jgi:L-ascorbate metabolism protein UlaG (beta-lactamase superfamily)
MSIQLTWLGHACWLIESGKTTIILDPFLDDSPTAPVKSDQVNPDFILVSHGHFDHVADVEKIARRTGAQVIAIFEISEWFRTKHKLKNVAGMNLGGRYNTPFGSVRMTPALHSSQMPDGSYGGNPAGFVLNIDERNIYFACDTALFSDMQLIGQAGIELAVLPIGDMFTMGIEDSVAATRLIAPKKVAPTHFNTWPPIEQDAEQWASRIRNETSAVPILSKPGEAFSI